MFESQIQSENQTLKLIWTSNSENVGYLSKNKVDDSRLFSFAVSISSFLKDAMILVRNDMNECE